MTTLDDYARLIGALEHLKRPFDRKQIGKLPATSKRPALDFVGHAIVCARLNQYAPDWSYTVDETFTHGGSFWIRGTMTICGVSRVEYGEGPNPLEAMSHFIRRAAMRFGVALDLWSREELEHVGSGAPSGETGGTETARVVAPDPSDTSEVQGEGATGGDPSPGEEAGSQAEAGGATRGETAPPATADHEPEWGPSPRPNLASKGWVVCRGGSCEVHQPMQRKASA